MLIKFLLGLAIAYLGWRLWSGPIRRTHPLPGTPIEDPRLAAARSLLGLSPDASVDDIRAAHRRLISAVHPDHGGTAELTRQVNAARDLLLRHGTAS